MVEDFDFVLANLFGFEFNLILVGVNLQQGPGGLGFTRARYDQIRTGQGCALKAEGKDLVHQASLCLRLRLILGWQLEHVDLERTAGHLFIVECHAEEMYNQILRHKGNVIESTTAH